MQFAVGSVLTDSDGRGSREVPIFIPLNGALPTQAVEVIVGCEQTEGV
jgi:hypothetical protein